MTTVTFQTSSNPLYKLFESFSTALKDMKDKANQILDEQQNVTEACNHLDAAENLLVFFIENLKQTDALEGRLPIEAEVSFRLLEDKIRSDMAPSSYAGLPSRVRQKMDGLNHHLDTFFGIIHQCYSASEEDLSWYYAMRDGTFNSKRHVVELSSQDWEVLQDRLENNTPNPRFERFFERVSAKSDIEIITHH